MNLLAFITAKNDSWYIERSLSRLAECVDGIIAIDDGSTDNTYDVLRACPTVIEIFRNPPGKIWNVFKDGEKMMTSIAKINPQWVMYVDSDDVLDKRFIQQRETLLSNQEVGRYHFKEVTLWRNNLNYRKDHPERWSRQRYRTPYLLRVAPSWSFGDPYSSTWRALMMRWMAKQWPVAYMRRRLTPGQKLSIPGKVGRMVNEVLWPTDKLDYTNLRPIGSFGKEVDLPLVKLHYHYANWEMAWQKHMYYVLNAGLQQMRAPGEIPDLVNWGASGFDETGIELAAVDPEWGAL